MTIQEALKEITSVYKWYAVTPCVDTQTWLRVTVTRIKNGTSKQQTIEKFFNILGYELETIVNKQNR